jgi:hypothetical protein
MTERVRPGTEYPAVPKQGAFMVKKIEYDDRGRPLFLNVLRDRPLNTGDQFTLVHTVNGRPMRSYDIAIVGQEKADINKPLGVIYKWTGKGFEVGAVITNSLGSCGGVASGDMLLACLVLLLAPLVIGTATGFVIGLVASIPDTTTELSHVIVNARETVVSYSVYEYDEKGRIKFIKLYPPGEHGEELVRTVFYYNAESDVPSRTDVTSRIEKKVRTIQYE